MTVPVAVNRLPSVSTPLVRPLSLSVGVGLNGTMKSDSANRAQSHQAA